MHINLYKAVKLWNTGKEKEIIKTLIREFHENQKINKWIK